jgi:hypothetical protein
MLADSPTITPEIARGQDVIHRGKKNKPREPNRRKGGDNLEARSRIRLPGESRQIVQY